MRTTLCISFKAQCIAVGLPDLYQSLDPVDDAAYNRCGHVAKCLPGTREQLIAKIVRWIDKSGGHPICWLNGPAGSGKSAVSKSISAWCDVRNRLAASFFFLRGAGNRSSITRFIPTLAYQLSISIPATKPLIQQVLRNEPTIARLPLSHQFEELLVKPILAVKTPFLNVLTPRKPMVMVIDALDECNDKDMMAEFIEVVTSACQENRGLPFRVFFTSRVEEHVRKKLDTSQARSAIYTLALPDFDARNDIRTFFQSRFSTIYEENRRLMQSHGIPLPWPSKPDLEALVDKASGSFIFAFTLVNFVNDGSDLPQLKLPIALRAHVGLDPLYAEVLTMGGHHHYCKRIISTIMLLTSPLSITALAHLLELDTADILQALFGIQSILMIPGNDSAPIQLFHTSLRDFLTTQSRSGNLFVDPPTRHIFIAADCLKAMTVPWLDAIFEDEAQQYACRNWCYHFLQALTEGANILLLSNGSLTDCLMDFMTWSFDSWFNTLVWCGEWRNILDTLHSILLQLEVSLVFY